MDALYESVIERFRPQIESGQVFVKRARSVDAAASFSDETLDWVYIDGDHSYEAVKRDLEAYYRVVKSGGFLAGDDYGAKNGWVWRRRDAGGRRVRRSMCRGDDHRHAVPAQEAVIGDARLTLQDGVRRAGALGARANTSDHAFKRVPE